MQAVESKQNLQIQKWVVSVSVILLIIKFIAYYFTSSVSILTDALESIVNVIAGFIGLYSLYISSLPRDINHPYGHGKAEFLSAAIEGTMIGIAGTVILYKAIYKLMIPSQIERLDLGIILISITAVINYGVGTYCVIKGKKNHSVALETSGKHLQTDTYSTLGVILGLTLLYFTKLFWIDSIVAIILGGFIVYVAYTIIRKSVAGIMDEADSQLLQSMIEKVNSRRRENWVDIHNLRVIKYGSVLHVDCHLTVPWYFTVNEAHEEMEILTKLNKEKFGESLELFVHLDGCTEFQCPICTKSNCAYRKSPFEKRIEWTLENVVQNEKHNTPKGENG
ncbi:MAG TPA: cation diffusion facilitator family transporter [Niabella sp.]|jgi:cation diffusion facilitator family transporter|nr:cation diffusion facilitator family transporter [Chitinophagaceae bacterium]HRN47130.1 cation diffusion facilitator family transporter [Niabella sp.]HRO84156.1 cation diffusion facilitator family transporter [Niabella sp.]HUN04576.1 cation diffusion facilitator family transporter [Niabella sp.]